MNRSGLAPLHLIPPRHHPPGGKSHCLHLHHSSRRLLPIRISPKPVRWRMASGRVRVRQGTKHQSQDRRAYIKLKKRDQAHATPPARNERTRQAKEKNTWVVHQPSYAQGGTIASRGQPFAGSGPHIPGIVMAMGAGTALGDSSSEDSLEPAAVPNREAPTVMSTSVTPPSR